MKTIRISDKNYSFIKELICEIPAGYIKSKFFYENPRVLKLFNILKEITNTPEYCEWSIEEPDYDETYFTSCGNAFYFTDGNIKENHVKFCPYCGKPIKEISREIPDE